MLDSELFLRVAHTPWVYARLLLDLTVDTQSHEIKTFNSVNKYLLFLTHFCNKKQTKVLGLS